MFAVILISRTSKYMLLSVFGMFLLYQSYSDIILMHSCCPLIPAKILRTVFCNPCNTAIGLLQYLSKTIGNLKVGTGKVEIALIPPTNRALRLSNFFHAQLNCA